MKKVAKFKIKIEDEIDCLTLQEGASGMDIKKD